MKFSLICPEITPGQRTHYHSAIGSLSAALKAAGHKTGLLHLVKPVDEKELIQSISEQAPDMVGFSTMTNGFRHVKKMAVMLKRHFNFPIICGGVHPTLDPEGTIREEGIDMVCIGEGEGALVELCNKMERGEDITAIPNLWVKVGKKVFRNPPRPLIKNLDVLPFEDRAIFDYERLEESRNHAARIMASRGCPYSCTYCCNRQIREVYKNKGRYVRFKSVDRLLSEIEQMIRSYPFIEFLIFHDDILPLRLDWLRHFAGEYKDRIGLPFRCNCRPDLVSEERIQLLRKAGCVKVNFGVESGNEYVRNQVLNRKITRTQIINAFALCRSQGIATQSFNMVGLPFEDAHSILDTIKLNAQIRPDMIMRSFFYPYPETELYQTCRRGGFLTDREFDTPYEGTIISQPTLSESQVNFAYQFFHELVKLYILCERLPRPFQILVGRVLDFLLCSKLVPHSLLAAS
ncbi:MAG: B12-binding domain-containing radical SAM protein, partial [Desulfobacterales bacterium]|nr:B12-binding domain-containing radical SAM protein [Desulfobacterales bacterium]